MSEAMEAESGKARKRSAIKAALEQKPKKTKVTIHLSREADQRLDIHCTMMGLDRSALMEKLINTHLRRWIVSDRGGQESGVEDAVA